MRTQTIIYRDYYCGTYTGRIMEFLLVVLGSFIDSVLMLMYGNGRWLWERSRVQILDIRDVIWLGLYTSPWSEVGCKTISHLAPFSSSTIPRSMSPNIRTTVLYHYITFGIQCSSQGIFYHKLPWKSIWFNLKIHLKIWYTQVYNKYCLSWLKFI